MSSLAIDPYAAINGGSNAPKTETRNEAGSEDRFLKLLVTQMQNQDPLNPMDNAQLTSQLAQINTVNGIEKLNTTVQGLNGQFLQMQALQGAALVGKDVTVKGDGLSIAGGSGVGGFELAGKADQVKVEVLSPAGRVVETLSLGALNAGRHGFEWASGNVPEGEPYRFRVTATLGGAAVAHTPLARDRVESVSTNSDGSLTLELSAKGSVAYRDIVAVGAP
jgi:flagellar basal-body rod modification protein FlgD